MLQGLDQVFCLVLVVSLHLGEALTCYSCGPHSDQVIPLSLTFSTEQDKRQGEAQRKGQKYTYRYQ